jgi:hypothetical protein
MKPGVNCKWGRRGARAKARSSPPCSFNLLMMPCVDQEFHHLMSPKNLSRQWGALHPDASLRSARRRRESMICFMPMFLSRPADH